MGPRSTSRAEVGSLSGENYAHMIYIAVIVKVIDRKIHLRVKGSRSFVNHFVGIVLSRRVAASRRREGHRSVYIKLRRERA